MLLDNSIPSVYAARYTAGMCESNDVKAMDECEELRDKREGTSLIYYWEYTTDGNYPSQVVQDIILDEIVANDRVNVKVTHWMTADRVPIYICNLMLSPEVHKDGLIFSLV